MMPNSPTGSRPTSDRTKPSFQLDATRLTSADRVTGIATLVLVVSLFLPWYGVSVFGFSAQVDGLTGHGYLYIVLIVCVTIVAYLIAAAGFEELPVQLPLSHPQRLLAGTVLNALLVLLAFLVKPGDSGWRFGAFAGIAAALVAAGPLVIPAIRARANRA
jgi:hypothetical protein